MNHRNIAIEINDILSEEDNRVDIDYENGNTKLTHTTLKQEDDDFFVMKFASEGLEKTKLSYESCSVLRGATEEIFDWINSEFGEQSSVATVHLFNNREDKIMVSTKYEFSEQDSSIFEKYGSWFEKNGKTHNVDVNDITKVEIRDSIMDGGIVDSTCYYKTETPQELYSNIQSLEEYARMLSDNAQKSEDDILEMDEYTVHYHPSNRDKLNSMTNWILQKYEKNISYPKFAELNIESLVIEPSSSEITVGVYIPLKQLELKS
jgi:hypothetical protein